MILIKHIEPIFQHGGFGLKNLQWLSLISVVFLMTGAGIAEESKPLNRGELYMYLADKTQHRSGWQIFHSGSGRLQALRDEQCDSGKWSTTEEGELCWHVTAWGERTCEIYLHDGESIAFIRDEEKSPAPEIIEGNTTNCPPVIFRSTVMTGVEKTEDFGDGLFSHDQTLALLSGNTVLWQGGRGLFYNENFTLVKTWDGVKGEGKWTVNDEGAACWDIPGWGPTPCEFYYQKNEILMRYANKKHSVAGQYLKGNQIGNL
jgi:hypothetical protein